jgi:hypothetical protein
MLYRTAGCALLALVLGATTGFAQVSSTGTIEIVATDTSGLPVPGVNVTARSADATTARTAVTDQEGRALLVALEPSTQYVVTIELDGFAPQRHENVLVRSGQTTTIRSTLTVGGLTEQVQVTAESPLVDTTSATTGQDITLQLTESLPTGRSYQSYLQLVPGVMPDDPSQPGNPASKSGLNYADIGGEVGISSDNAYYIDGINVTDPRTGTFGANLNTEIIQEQKVITGAIPAEFVGVPGLLTNVVLKAGSNTLHGSGNYYVQNDALVAENKNSEDEEFSTFDTAFTFGGPIVRDYAWFFGSYRRTERDDDVTSLDTLELLRSVNNTQNQGYARGTWAPTSNDTLSFTFLNDPTDITGRRDRELTNARDRAREQGGNRYAINYSRLVGGALFEAAFNIHNGEVSDFSAIREAFNDVLYRSTDDRTLDDEQLGGYGRDLIDQRDVKLGTATLQWNFGRHTVKGGGEFQMNQNFRNTLYIDGATYTSVAPHLSGITAGDIATGSFGVSIGFDPFNTSDFEGLIRTINGLPNRAAFYGAFDGNGDGTITADELGARLTFSSTTGNPNGLINYDRTFQAQEGPQETESKGLSFFVQDNFAVGDRLTLNLGLRMEQWKHFATTGDNIFTFDWEYAPRLSAIYDVAGDGRQKAFAYWGRYYDPIRNNMTNFAGTLTGSVLEEQVFMLGQWVNFRTRGGQTQQDAFFAPTTQTPYTDDLELGYEVDLGRNLSLGATYTNRRTRDILEDYDLSLYAVDTAGSTAAYPGPIDHPDSLWLGLDYFGYQENPGSNFVIATLEGGERNYQGIELVLRKRYSDRWQALISYTYNDAEGNTNSDSNADFQGDVLYLDPRAPGQYARQPGNIPHLFKAAGSYTFNMGLELGAAYRWNSGTIASRAELRSSRNLPIRVPVGQTFEFAGITTERWIQPGSVGTFENPSWGEIDLRAQYRYRINPATLEFFVDMFNVFDNQDSIRNQDLVAGQGGVAFGEPIRFLGPRRFFLGTRVSF